MTTTTDRAQADFDRCKAFPEAGKRDGFYLVRPDAYMALLECRNLIPELITEAGK